MLNGMIKNALAICNKLKIKNSKKSKHGKGIIHENPITQDAYHPCRKDKQELSSCLW